MYTFKKDRYQQARGGTSRILDISCEGCGHHVAFYQKDGPGILKRMYVDRCINEQPNGADLVCAACDRIIGHRIHYKKEDRAAYRLYVGAVKKKIISRRSIV
jgi:hypothetical protein